MHRYKRWARPLLFLLTAAVLAAALAAALAAHTGGERERAGLAQSRTDRQLEQMQDRYDRLQEEVREAERRIEELRDRLDSMPDFLPYDISLPEEEQAAAYQAGRESGVELRLLLALMYQESGWQWQEPVRDANGLWSVGYMMINESAWPYLEREGYDVHDPVGNIRAGAHLLGNYLEKYPVEQALVAYNCGEGRMLERGWTSTAYSRAVLERAYPAGKEADANGR